jgi:hypothetical protein
VNSSIAYNAIFSSNGTVNDTKYILITERLASPILVLVLSNGTIAMRSESGEKAIMQCESIGQRNPSSGIDLDNGIMFFKELTTAATTMATNATNSANVTAAGSAGTRGLSSLLYNTVAVYKDMINERRGNLTTIAW